MKNAHRKIVIAGGSGLLGQALVAHFNRQEFEIVILSRGKQVDQENVRWVQWDGEVLGSWINELENANALINLSGRSVDCRYTRKNRAEILNSRLHSTALLGEALYYVHKRPKVWLNASSATIYRHSEDKAMTEENGECGHGFSVDVCRAWEQKFFRYKRPGMRLASLRAALVLSKVGGALEPLAGLARAGLGGNQGNGRQMMSWIHEQDFCRAVEFVLTNETMEGPVNLAAPNPLRNTDFMATLRETLNAKIGIPIPRVLLELGAILIKTETELILKSRWVLPEKLLNAGFDFSYPKLQEALSNLLGEEGRSHQIIWT